jgi:hypothetical protein
LIIIGIITVVDVIIGSQSCRTLTSASQSATRQCARQRVVDELQRQPMQSRRIARRRFAQTSARIAVGKVAARARIGASTSQRCRREAAVDRCRRALWHRFQAWRHATQTARAYTCRCIHTQLRQRPPAVRSYCRLTWNIFE